VLGRQIEQEYGATGQVRIEWKHFAFLGDESQWAAEASECAGEQDRFWPYHDRLFQETQGRGKGVFEKPLLKRYASEVGLDRAAFDQCLDSGRYSARVRAASDEARRAGIERTPTLEINGERVTGVPSWEEIRALIERAQTKGAS
jgi:protein-disulfide isomerase